MSFASMLPEVLTVERPAAPTRDSSGGVVQAWQTRAVGIAAQVNEVSAAQQLRFASLQMNVTHEVMTEYAEVQNGDRLLTDTGEYLRVVGARRVRAQGSLGEHYEITADLVRP